ncbi:MAG: hypothetical protein Kapaf2KO_20710 [Candidatus Kapaibacteriales bacterium]
MILLIVFACISLDTKANDDITFEEDPEIVYPDGLILCGDRPESLRLHANTFFFSKRWSYIPQGDSVNIGLGGADTLLLAGPGLYIMDVEGSGGCMGSDTVRVTWGKEPDAEITTTGTLCGGGEVTLFAQPHDPDSLDKYTYLWENGSTQRERRITSAGDYFLTVTDTAGCEGTAEIRIDDGGEAVIAIIEGETVVCGDNPETTLTALPFDQNDPNRYSYQWLDGSSDRIRNISSTGTYTLVVTERGVGCPPDTTSVDITLSDANLELRYIGLDGIEVEYGTQEVLTPYLLTNTGGEPLDIEMTISDVQGLSNITLGIGEQRQILVYGQTNTLGDSQTSISLNATSVGAGCKLEALATADYYVYGRMMLSLSQEQPQTTGPGLEIDIPLSGWTLSEGLQATTDINATLSFSDPYFSPLPANAGEVLPLTISQENVTLSNQKRTVGVFSGISPLIGSGNYELSLSNSIISGGDSDHLRLEIENGEINYDEHCYSNMRLVTAAPGFNVTLSDNTIHITQTSGRASSLSATATSITGALADSQTLQNAGNTYTYPLTSLTSGSYHITLTANGQPIWSGMISLVR